jgi:hypothetical protein
MVGRALQSLRAAREGPLRRVPALAARWNAAAWVAATLLAISCRAAAEEDAWFGPLGLGARFEYMMVLDEQSNPYPWNAATHSASDLSRFMVDLDIPSESYGSLYLKGAATWALVDADDVQKRLRFEQGDYLWRRMSDRDDLSLRVFANERRYFVHDWVSPLLDDDRAGGTPDNRGVRVDASMGGKFEVTGLYSLFGTDFDRSKSASYLKVRYSHRVASLSASYLVQDPGASGPSNRALFKTELASAYGRLFGVLSYEQTGLDDSHVFFPGGSFDWGEYDGTNFSAILPRGGAAIAELRLASMSTAERGDVDLVWRYEAVGEDFTNDLGQAGPSGTGQTFGAYFLGRSASVNAKALYHSRTRSVLESEETGRFDAALWAAFKNGMDGFLRGGAGEVDDGSEFAPKKNFVHGAIGRKSTRVSTAFHAMTYDIDTEYSGTRFAWDGKVVLNPSWGLHWRFLAGEDIAVGQSAFFRLEYRPSDRIYATVTYGRSYLGDDPFVLEDSQLGLMREESSQYAISLRGDF